MSKEATWSEPHVVVVLNWRGRTDTLACVESLVEGSPEAQVLVVDNGSADGTLEAVAERWPAVHLVALDRNHGFSGGMNRGIRHAMDELAAGTVTILNNDTVISPGAMTALASIAESADVAVCPVVRYRDDPDKLWFGGGSLDVANGFPFHTAPEDLELCESGLRSSTVLAGCCITARSDAWRRVGLFDERFFLNFEDSEWSLRAAACGIRLVVACDVSILHAVSASFTGSAARLGTFYYLRNGLLFARLAGAGLRARMEFVRRFGLAGTRHLGSRGRARALLLLAWAIGADVARRYGEAPLALQRRVARWSQESE
ncbi:glycosyltransferase family 2 protein [Microbacterium sp.]|uniref:glycosyltransferase family 2 protein n=1 Tax=Microbacterium sp. TaxID=51671 RepID=UPI0025F03604|nr:glycosyltransferase family 2 protein [Microbacterium sp.]